MKRREPEQDEDVGDVIQRLLKRTFWRRLAPSSSVSLILPRFRLLCVAAARTCVGAGFNLGDDALESDGSPFLLLQGKGLEPGINDGSHLINALV